MDICEITRVNNVSFQIPAPRTRDALGFPPDSIKYVAIVRYQKIQGGHSIVLEEKFSLLWPGIVSNDKQLRQDLLKESFEISKEPLLGEPPLFV